MKKIDFEQITLRKEISSRGGGIEVSLDTLGFKGVRMTAYQNYLGGGMLGRVCDDCSLKGWQDDRKLSAIAEQLRRYFHFLTNSKGTWEATTYEQNQSMAVSAY